MIKLAAAFCVRLLWYLKNNNFTVARHWTMFRDKNLIFSERIIIIILMIVITWYDNRVIILII